MKIEIFDPIISGSPDACGPGVDPELIRIYDALRKIQKSAPDILLLRHGLATDPMSFSDNAAVAELLVREGEECLPLGFIDDELISKGSYPTDEQLMELLTRSGYDIQLGGEKRCGAGCC
jgi:hypothetical protein